MALSLAGNGVRWPPPTTGTWTACVRHAPNLMAVPAANKQTNKQTTSDVGTQTHETDARETGRDNHRRANAEGRRRHDAYLVPERTAERA
eukprot:226655-Prymnesium_polylepis.1